MRKVFIFAALVVGSVVAGIGAVFIVAALSGCGGGEPQVIAPNPAGADRVLDKGIAERMCLRDAASVKVADDCIAAIRNDGGVR